MNDNVAYKSTITTFKEWDEANRVGIINVTLRENPAENFDIAVEYIPQEKILAFYEVGGDAFTSERIQPWRLIQELIRTGKAPEVKPHIPPAILKLRELVKNDPCPPIKITNYERDVLYFGLLHNPANTVMEPWNDFRTVVKVPSNTIIKSVKTQDIRKGKIVPSVMSSLTKKGLIQSSGKEGAERMCQLTKTGVLVLRREVTGA
ncbi:MAG: hypothetical protein WC102_03250 [Saccharofermentanales bacterium]